MMGMMLEIGLKFPTPVYDPDVKVTDLEISYTFMDFIISWHDGIYKTFKSFS